MPDASTLEGLALRVEQSAGADREIDCLIWCALNGIEPEWSGENGHVLYAGIEGAIGWIDPGVHQRNFSTNRSITGPASIAPYTASLDAAMLLIDWTWLKANGFYFSLSQEFYDDHRWTARADTGGDECGTGETIMSGYCDDMVRAALSFALKALASIAREGGSDE